MSVGEKILRYKDALLKDLEGITAFPSVSLKVQELS